MQNAKYRSAKNGGNVSIPQPQLEDYSLQPAPFAAQKLLAKSTDVLRTPSCILRMLSTAGMEVNDFDLVLQRNVAVPTT